jgi:4'-phosphopantetheinyl transferase
MLDARERDRLSKFLRLDSKQRFAICRALMKQILSPYVQIKPSNISFEYTAELKPFLKNSPIYFNLSHSHELAIVGISAYQIGVDIEKIDPFRNIEGLINEIFTQSEKEWIYKENTVKRFYKLWTMKEAHYKCTENRSTYSYFSSVFFNKRGFPYFPDCQTFSIHYKKYMISICFKN